MDSYAPGPSSSCNHFGCRSEINRAIPYGNGPSETVGYAPEGISESLLDSLIPYTSKCAPPLDGLDLLGAVGSAFIQHSNFQDIFQDSLTTSSKIRRTKAAITTDCEDSHNEAEETTASRHAQHATESIPNRPLDASQDTKAITSEPDSKKSSPKLISCQWADGNGQPCGKCFHLADDLHSHLKQAHSAKNSLICRWLGCPVGAFTANPHKYANGVQRHTWGHSGYRPYKCTVCGEGFAAANVRDEHFSNIHLKKKLFSCDVCNHQCTSATNLKRHKDERHRAERFQCEFCNRHGKIRLFPRGPNLARHFRKCKFVLASFPEAKGAAEGKIDDTWYPPGYKKGHHGMDKAKITPPKYLPS